MSRPIRGGGSRRTRRSISLVALVACAALALVAWGAWGPGSAATPQIVRHTLSMAQPDLPRSNGSFAVDVWRGGAWQPEGLTEHDKYSRTRTLALDGLEPGAPLRVRLAKQGGGGAHLDAVLLDGAGPLAAEGAELRKLGAADNDLTDAYQSAVTLTFAAPGKPQATLSVAGRIEAVTLSKTPFQFPLRNLYRPITEHAAFYRYRLGSAPGALSIDGVLKGESLGTPLFSENPIVGSGHPRSPITGWARDDGRTLYVALDFTADNTLDPGLDYAKVYAKTPGGLKVFPLNTADTTWGRAGFTYTDGVAWEHKTYEFAIPLAELGLAGAAPGTEVPLAFAAYGTATPGLGEFYPTLAYDPNRNRYLLVHARSGAGGMSELHGQLLNSDGSANGSSFAIATGNNFLNPAVAFDPFAERFLVVWEDQRAAPDPVAIFGQIVDADGTLFDQDGSGTPEPFADSFQISSGAVGEGFPAVAFDPANRRFLVVWNDSGSNGVIGGQLVNPDGTLFDQDGSGAADPAGDNIVISVAAKGRSEPALAYDTATGRFLVAWKDQRMLNNYIYGQLVNGDGTLFDQDGSGSADATLDYIAISNSNSVFRATPAVAYDPLSGRFLVAWEDDRVGGITQDIYGQLVNGDGTLFDQDKDGTPDPVLDNIVISGSVSDQYETYAAYNAGRDRFVVIWQDIDASTAARGQLVRSDGTLDGADAEIVVSEGGYASDIHALAANHFCGNDLVVIEDYEFVTPAYFLDIAVWGTCTPAYQWASFPFDAPGGVAAGSAAGDTFTFRVRYLGAAAPTQAELQIDLGGDGQFAAATTAAAPGSGGSAAPLLPSALALAGLGLALLWTARPPRRARGFAAAVLVTSALVAAGVVACSSSSSAPAAERYTMTQVDAGDTTYTDGALYTVDLTIASAGTFAYRFAFGDGSTAAIGPAAQQRSLTVP